MLLTFLLCLIFVPRAMKRYLCSNLLVLCILFAIGCMLILTIAKFGRLEKVETQETLGSAVTNEFDVSSVF